MIGLPSGVQPFEDVVAAHVHLHMTVHRPGPERTGCGESIQLMQPPIGAYLADGLAARWCEKPGCFEHENAWTPLVDAAHPTPPRRSANVQSPNRERFPMNSSSRWRGLAAFLHLNGRRA